MHELIGRIVADIGGERAAADQAVVVSPFRRGEWRMNDAAADIRMRGTRASMLQSHISLSFEGVAADIHVAAAGEAMGTLPTVDRGTVGRARHMAGENAVDHSVGAVPCRIV